MPAPIAALGRGSLLKPIEGGVPPVVEYGFPGGTSLRMLRQPEAAMTVPKTMTKVPAARRRLSRSIDIISSSRPRRPTPSGVAANVSVLRFH